MLEEIDRALGRFNLERQNTQASYQELNGLSDVLILAALLKFEVFLFGSLQTLFGYACEIQFWKLRLIALVEATL